MSGTSIKQLVDRGWELRRQIKALKKELDGIEESLSSTSLWKDHDFLKDADREGRRYMAHGSERVVPVVFTADKIMSQFQDGGPAHDKILAASQHRLPSFFKPKKVWENLFDDGNKFRKAAGELLGQNAPPFVTACIARDKQGIPKSDIKICWDDAEETKAKEVA